MTGVVRNGTQSVTDLPCLPAGRLPQAGSVTGGTETVTDAAGPLGSDSFLSKLEVKS